MSSSSSSLKDLAFGDVHREIDVTRRVLERLPADRFLWKVHEKSMSLGNLAVHVADLLRWCLDTLEKDELDITNASPAPYDKIKSHVEMLAYFEKNVKAVLAAMARTDDAALARTWQLRQGEQVLVSQPKAKILRLYCLSHLIHHRAQLCVYLRLLDVPVPAVYFSSADEPEWILT